MRVCRFPFPHLSAEYARALPAAGDLIRHGRSGEISASTFGPPLPVDRPG